MTSVAWFFKITLTIICSKMVNLGTEEILLGSLCFICKGNLSVSMLKTKTNSFDAKENWVFNVRALKCQLYHE